MRCEFCEGELPEAEPENIALMQHVQERQECSERFGYMLENLEGSWTKAMSGG